MATLSEQIAERRAKLEGGMSLSDKISARRSQLSEKVIATTKDGGRVIETANGLAFTSPGYSTTNPDQIAKIMEGATPADVSMSGFDRQTIAQHPIASRAAKAVQGVPFAGEWADEAVGAVSKQAGAAMRASQNAMDREIPGQSTALQIGGGIAGAIPMAIAAGPSIVGRAVSPLGRVVAGGLAGAAGGGVEGAISGAGAGNDGSRADSAMQRGVVGALIGGAVGGAVPIVSAGIRKLVERIKSSDVSTIARELSISDDAARVVRRAIENDDLDAAEAAIRRAGGRAMLADAGQGTQALLDASIATGGKGGRIAREAIDARASDAGAGLTAAMDRTLGEADGAGSIAQGIRTGTQAARSAAYDKAYASAIDYSGPDGRTVESLTRRVPASAIRKADALMRLEGVDGLQKMISIADDGSITLTRMPGVREIDYITRGLNDVAAAADGAGKLGGTTQEGRALSSLAKSLRSATRKAAPAYAEALDTAADAISRKNAADLGYSMLRQSVTREQVADGLAGASKSEISAAKQGLRSYVDDTLANVRRTITDPNVDVREVQKLVKDLSSRSSKAKITVLLGREAKTIMDAMDDAARALEVRAAIATNSKTAVRQAIQGAVGEQTAPGAVATLLQGKPVDFGRRVAQALTGQTPEAVALRQQGIYDEIAKALTMIKGQDAQRALFQIRRAMSGQPIANEQARLIGEVMSRGLGLSAYESGETALR